MILCYLEQKENQIVKAKNSLVKVWAGLSSPFRFLSTFSGGWQEMVPAVIYRYKNMMLKRDAGLAVEDHICRL